MSGRKMEPGMNGPALHVTRRYATANWRLDEISADQAKSASQLQVNPDTASDVPL